MLMRNLFLALLLLATAGCASFADEYATVVEKREDFGVLVREDLMEASRSAHVHADRVAYICYDELLAILDEAGQDGFFTDPTKGVFSTFQKARNTRRLFEGDTGVRIRLACSALREETRERIGAVIGFIRNLPLIP